MAQARSPAPPAPPLFKDLPEAQRRQLPALTVGGSMYSDTPANRLLILNGQLLREGDVLAPGLSLESIRLKEAVLVHRGERFRITY